MQKYMKITKIEERLDEDQDEESDRHIEARDL